MTDDLDIAQMLRLKDSQLDGEWICLFHVERKNLSIVQ
jgi:hypothetical protein